MMKRNINEYLPAALNLISGVGVLLISFLVELRFPIQKGIAKLLGLVIVYAGMALVIWAALYIRGEIAGIVEPRLNTLVKHGPYRFVRHPVYLGTSIALLGATIALRSWMGLIGVFFLFLPSEVHRAKLEEKALKCKFGDEWENYAARTAFFLPFIGKG